MHLTLCALALALPSAGSSILARMAMIAITTSNSIKVNFFFLIFLRSFRFIVSVRSGNKNIIINAITFNNFISPKKLIRRFAPV